MRLLVDNINPEHEEYLTRLVKELGGNITVLDITEEEEDNALLKALHQASADEPASKREVGNFLRNLGQ